jgi:TolB-like protein
MGADEEGTHERLKAHLRELVEPKIGEHRGRVVKKTGDGFLAEFASVVDAVRCAVEVQRGMAEREPEVPEERRIRFRVGINLGDVIAEEHDIFGDGVNVAARLEALAEPGGICVSRVVRDQVRDRLDFAFEDLGEQSVKNIARPVRAYALRPQAIAKLQSASLLRAVPRRRHAAPAAIAAATIGVLVVAAGGWWFWPTTRPTLTPAVAAARSIAQPLAAPRLSIVVLPFANLSNDSEQQYFADGITDDLTTDLSRIHDSFVISRNTAFTYRNKPVDTKQIGRELGVRYVLEGSVRRSSNKVRVNAQLIDAETDAHLWADQFDCDISDVFALQNEITTRIAITLNVKLSRREAARPTDNADALDYILRGRVAYWKPNSPEKWAETLNLFEHALALDPHSVEAQSQVANMLALRAGNGRGASPAADLQRAEALVEHALAASPQDWLAHYAKGSVLRYQGRCDEAIQEYETALALNPNWPNSLWLLGACKLLTGSIEEVIPLAQQAIRLSPRDPYIGDFLDEIGLVHLLQSHIDDAIAWFEKSRSTPTGLPGRHSLLASAYALKGETERAFSELAAQGLTGDSRYTNIARVIAAGRTWGPPGDWGIPKVRALFEATYFAGLRKAGMP